MIAGLQLTAAVALAAAVAGFGAGWGAQGVRAERTVAQQAAKHADAMRKDAEEDRQAAQEVLRRANLLTEKADEAQRNAEARAAVHKRAADSALRELAGLRTDLASVPGRIQLASREAVNQYAATATAVFEQCTARYQRLAEAADGHASDVQTLTEGWPRLPAAGNKPKETK